jgi:hypothetical protein
MKTRTQHIRHITIQVNMDNNKMERLNGEIRDRESHAGLEEARDSDYSTLSDLPRLRQTA